METPHNPLRVIKCSDVLLNCTAEQAERVEEYMAKFAIPETTDLGVKCTNCGDYFAGTMGVANWPKVEDGTGTCYTCGQPFRFIHDIPNVGVIKNLPLMYRRREDHTCIILP